MKKIVKVKLSDYESALEDYSQAIRLDSGSALTFFNRAYAFYSFGKYQEAIQDYDKSIALEPANDQSYYGRGSNYCKEVTTKFYEKRSGEKFLVIL